MRAVAEIKRRVQTGRYDPTLARLYCRPTDQLGPFRQRIHTILDGYTRCFDRGEEAEVAIFSAPGRTEIGGNHTDHQGGKVLTGSVDLDALACAGPNGTRSVRIYSEGYGLTEIDCANLAPVKEEENTTRALVRGVLAGVNQRGLAVSGFDAYILSDVPGGSGLSSSACFEVLLGTVINSLFCREALSMVDLAQIGQYAENVYFGKPSGLMDQMGCALGGIVVIDFKHREAPVYHPVRCDFASAGYALCILDTGADHADLTEDYAAVPAEMGAIARAFGQDLLSEVEADHFYRAIPDLHKSFGDRSVLRALHYFAECKRVDRQVKALEQGDFDHFLNLVNASGRSSFMYLQNIDTYRDSGKQPLALALAMAEHYLGSRGACRVHGGGFAGTIQAFVPLDEVEAFKEQMENLFGAGACRVTSIRPVGGCVLVD